MMRRGGRETKEFEGKLVQGRCVMYSLSVKSQNEREGERWKIALKRKRGYKEWKEGKKTKDLEQDFRG